MVHVQKTFAIVKPDAVQAGNTQNIINMIKEHGFKILAEQPIHWNRAQAEQFYAIHSARPFFGELVEFMISGPVVMLVLEKDNAVLAWRDLMGATNPKEAAAGTVRSLYGASIGNNATHGSDSVENAKTEIGQFFPELV